MSDRSGKLARWHLRVSKFKCNIVQRAGIKKHAADTLYKFPIIRTDQIWLDNEIPEKHIKQGALRTACNVGIEQGDEEAENYSTLKREFVSCLSKLYALDHKAGGSNLDVLNFC